MACVVKRPQSSIDEAHVMNFIAKQVISFTTTILFKRMFCLEGSIRKQGGGGVIFCTDKSWN